MLRRARIDREDELILLNQIALGQVSERLLFISADTGMGKSELLREFKALCSKDISNSMIDFKNGSISQTDLIYNICEDLGWVHFPMLDNALKDLLELPNINISKNILIGQNRISILISRFDKPISSIYLASITKVFFEDLRRLRHVVLILDTFENANIRLKKWIMNVFLHYALSSPNLAVIISGQDLPQPPAEWIDLSYVLKLGGIEAIHWHKYAESMGLSLELTWFEGCCFAINSHPLRMAQILSIYLEQVENQ